jgi:hypothetical protein
VHSLPILTLDERVLSPRFGYVFHAAWLEPFESILGMLWKFVRVNGLSGAAVVAQLGRAPVDAYSGLEASPTEVHTRVVARLLRITHSQVLAGFIRTDGEEGRAFRYCPRCLSMGYHGVAHQMERHRSCPAHHCALEQRCRSCGCGSVYRLDARLLDGPYRCRHCRRYFASPVPAASVQRRRMTLRERVGITRSMLA